MRIPKSAHTEQPWRIHEFTRDFRVDDVWSFRVPDAGPDDFPVMVKALKTAYDSRTDPWPVRFLFAVRWKLGALLGWDTERAGFGGRVDSLTRRLPPGIARTVEDAVPASDPFSEVYQLHDEAARELGNRTVHTVMHLGWVPVGDGAYELRMAALVKPNGLFGRCYMAFILPFRYLVVYPVLTRQWEQAWLDHGRPNRRGREGASAG